MCSSRLPPTRSSRARRGSGSMPPSAANDGGPQLSDPYLTDLCAKARAEFDQAKRVDYLIKIQQYAIEHRVGYTITDEVGFGLYNSARVKDTSSQITTLKPQFVRPAA